MRTKKRVRDSIVVGLLTVAMALSAVGCSSGTDQGSTPEQPETEQGKEEKQEKTAITMWHYYSGAQKAAFDSMVEEFNETVGIEKGISVTASAMGSVADLTEAVVDSAEETVGAQKLPDMFVTYIDTAMRVDAMGKLAALDPYFTEEELDEYVEEYVSEGRFDEEGSLKVFPIAKATEVMMINKTEWDRFSAETGAKMGWLETWEGMINVASKYYEWSGGKAFFGRDALANYVLTGSRELGQEIFEVDGGTVTLHFDRDIMRRIWDNYYVPYIHGYFLKEGRFASDDLKVGSIIAYVGSTSSASYFPDSVYLEGDETGTPIECLVRKVPSFEEVEESFVVQQGAGCAVVRSSEEKERACAEFLKWFTDCERNTRFALSASYLPVKKDANNVEYMKKIAEEKELDLPGMVKDALVVSMNEINDSHLYTTQGFENGYDARMILENSLKDKAISDKAAIDEMTASGMTMEDAAAQFDTEENFAQWYEETLEQLNGLLEK